MFPQPEDSKITFLDGTASTQSYVKIGMFEKNNIGLQTLFVSPMKHLWVFPTKIRIALEPDSAYSHGWEVEDVFQLRACAKRENSASFMTPPFSIARPEKNWGVDQIVTYLVETNGIFVPYDLLSDMEEVTLLPEKEYVEAIRAIIGVALAGEDKPDEAGNIKTPAKVFEESFLN